MSQLFKTIKRGTSFEGTVLYVPRTGTLANLIGCTAFSRVKDSAGKRHTLDCTISEDGLSIVIVGTPSVTKDFAVGPAFWDVGVESPSGSIIPTKTWQFEVEDFISDKYK